MNSLTYESTILRFRRLFKYNNKLFLKNSFSDQVNDLLSGLDLGTHKKLPQSVAQLAQAGEQKLEEKRLMPIFFRACAAATEVITGVEEHVTIRPSKIRGLADSGWAVLLEQAEKVKADVRAKVERPFRVIKRQFEHVFIHYRSLTKNTAQLVNMFALSNFLMVQKRFLKGLQAWVRLQKWNRLKEGQ
jgi:hypothetical protein